MDNNDITLTGLAKAILKLSEYIQDYPFLIYGVIAIFGFPLFVAIIFYVVKNLIVTVICLVLLFLLMVLCVISESKANNNEIGERKKRFRRERQ